MDATTGEATRPAAPEVIYEVESIIDPAVLADFDAWLPAHVQRVIACRGFNGAEIQAPRVPPGEAPRRRVQYRLESAAALDHYLENDAPRLRAESANFGDKVRFERRVFERKEGLLSPARIPPRCLDCGASVTSSFCGNCGQAGHTHVMSISEVFEDATHSLLHVDSRLWRTLRMLLLRPGELTNEFIAGRRQRYLPPFRLYLVISLLFFGLKALLPGSEAVKLDEKSVDVVSPAQPPATTSPGSAAGEAEQDADRQRAAQELADVAADPTTPAIVADAARVGSASVRPGPAEEGDCHIDIGTPGLRWLGPVLNRACERVRADGGRHLGEVFLHNAPKLMFVFLPLVAAAAMLFYWRPRRFYAEHLVFFLHGHAFVFLILAALDLGGAAERQWPLLEAPIGIVGTIAVLYSFWYLYRAMRVVYRNGRALTLVKFCVLSIAYFVLLGVTMAVGMLYSMMTL